MPPTPDPVPVPVPVGSSPRRNGLRSGRTAVRVRYSAIGLVLGGAWLANVGLPPWEHALRLLVLVLALVPLATRARALVLRRRGRPVRASPHLRGLVIAKVVLVVVALGVELVLELWTTEVVATEVVAVLLVAVVALGGPFADGWIRSGGRHLRGVPLPSE